MIATLTKPRPFIKWVGGKAKLLDQLGPMLPKFSGRYFEPFLGGGAMFFHLAPKQATISDINPELVNLYQVVRDDVELLVSDLRSQHQYTADYYYYLRALDRDVEAFSRINPIKRASRFIFLNKTCFNGLWRETTNGFMNAPMGRYKNPNWCDSDNLRATSKALQGVEINCGSFSTLLSRGKPLGLNDFLYLDPPYMPVDQNSFTSYSKQGFDMDDQIALRDFCHQIDRNGAKFMLSNSSAPILREMYQDYRIDTIYANRNINSKASNRGPVPEIVVRNY